MIYADSGAYVNYQVEDNYEEFREMSEQNRNMFRQECIEALRPFETSEGLTPEWEVLYFTGYK